MPSTTSSCSWTGTSPGASRYTLAVPDHPNIIRGCPAGDPADVELLCLDVDGVMTDGSIILAPDGGEQKRFHVRDGLAMKAWMRAGYRLAVITGRGGPALRHRMTELGVELVREHVADKGVAVREVQEGLGIQPARTAFMGDDLADLPAFAGSGYAMAPSDADPDVLKRSDWIATRKGGDAAVREAIEHLLRSRGAWDDVVARHLEAGNLA